MRASKRKKAIERLAQAQASDPEIKGADTSVDSDAPATPAASTSADHGSAAAAAAEQRALQAIAQAEESRHGTGLVDWRAHYDELAGATLVLLGERHLTRNRDRTQAAPHN